MKTVFWIFFLAFILAIFMIVWVDWEIDNRLENQVDSTCEDVRFLKDIPQERCIDYKYN